MFTKLKLKRVQVHNCFFMCLLFITKNNTMSPCHHVLHIGLPEKLSQGYMKSINLELGILLRETILLLKI